MFKLCSCPGGGGNAARLDAETCPQPFRPEAHPGLRGGKQGGAGIRDTAPPQGVRRGMRGAGAGAEPEAEDAPGVPRREARGAATDTDDAAEGAEGVHLHEDPLLSSWPPSS